MRHKQFRELIDAYLNHELPEDLHESFKEHMMTCASCKKRLLLNLAIIKGIERYGEELLAIEPEPSLSQRVKGFFNPLFSPRPLNAPAVLLLCAILGVGIYVVNHPVVIYTVRTFLFSPPEQPIDSAQTFYIAPEAQDLTYWTYRYGTLAPDEDPLIQKTHDIYQRIIQAAALPKGTSPVLVILKKAPELIFSLLGFILISQKCLLMYERMFQDTKDTDLVLAFILGHELAHHINNDPARMHQINTAPIAGIEKSGESPRKRTDERRYNLRKTTAQPSAPPGKCPGTGTGERPGR